MAELERVISRIGRALLDSRLDHVVVGGFAAIFRGKPRTTTDIDLIVEHDPSKIQTFISHLKEANFDVMDEQVSLALDAREQASIFDKESILRIDLKEAFTRDEKDAMENGKWENVMGIKIKVATPLDILYGKIKFMGKIENIPDDELLESNDVRDFIAVLNKNPSINVDELKEKAKKIRREKTLDKLLRLSSSIGKK